MNLESVRTVYKSRPISEPLNRRLRLSFSGVRTDQKFILIRGVRCVNVPKQKNRIPGLTPHTDNHC